MSIILFGACLCGMEVQPQNQSEDEASAYLTTNLVAALVGYYTTREVAHGIRVPFFSPSRSVGDSNTCSVLMYVIAPTNYAGMFFLLTGDDSFNQHETSSYFRPDKFYAFPISDSRHDPGEVKLDDIRSILFDPLLFDNQGTWFRLKNVTKGRYFVAEQEITDRLYELESWRSDSLKRITELSRSLNGNVSEREKRKRTSDYKTLHNELMLIDMQKSDANRQKTFARQQWEMLRIHEPFGLEEGSDYRNEGEKIKANGQ